MAGHLVCPSCAEKHSECPTCGGIIDDIAPSGDVSSASAYWLTRLQPRCSHQACPFVAADTRTVQLHELLSCPFRTVAGITPAPPAPATTGLSTIITARDVTLTLWGHIPPDVRPYCTRVAVSTDTVRVLSTSDPVCIVVRWGTSSGEYFCAWNQDTVQIRPAMRAQTSLNICAVYPFHRFPDNPVPSFADRDCSIRWTDHVDRACTSVIAHPAAPYPRTHMPLTLHPDLLQCAALLADAPQGIYFHAREGPVDALVYMPSDNHLATGCTVNCGSCGKQYDVHHTMSSLLAHTAVPMDVFARAARINSHTRMHSSDLTPCGARVWCTDFAWEMLPACARLHRDICPPDAIGLYGTIVNTAPGRARFIGVIDSDPLMCAICNEPLDRSPDAVAAHFNIDTPSVLKFCRVASCMGGTQFDTSVCLSFAPLASIDD
jgi:hypothetical protein